jgi:hypothetical protein
MPMHFSLMTEATSAMLGVLSILPAQLIELNKVNERL